MEQVLSYPFPVSIVGDLRGSAFAYVLDTRGICSLWFAQAPSFTPRELFSSQSDDGQELTHLSISPDDAHVVYVRGGYHGGNWTEPLPPDPDLSPIQPQMQVWSIATNTGVAKQLGNGDVPVISPDGTRVAFTNDGAVTIAPIDAGAPAKRLFFDRGQDSDIRWSPDGSALAFVSSRGNHSFIGVYRSETQPVEFLSPTTSQDIMPRWSLDGKRIAFVRTPGMGGAPLNPLDRTPQPWQIWVAGDVALGLARCAWSSTQPSTRLAA